MLFKEMEKGLLFSLSLAIPQTSHKDPSKRKLVYTLHYV